MPVFLCHIAFCQLLQPLMMGNVHVHSPHGPTVLKKLMELNLSLFTLIKTWPKSQWPGESGMQKFPCVGGISAELFVLV